MKQAVSKERPEATCRQCSSSVRVIKHTTFSYWYCDKCKDEVDVWLRTVPSPRGEKYGYVSEPNDVVISEPGVYRIDYLDGSFEFFEHRSKSRDTVIRGDGVQATTRITERDLPSRKQVQQVPKASEGTKDEGLSVRAISDEEDSVQGSLPLSIWGQAIAVDPGSISRAVYMDSQGTLRYVDDGTEFLQHWQMPPGDTL